MTNLFEIDLPNGSIHVAKRQMSLEAYKTFVRNSCTYLVEYPFELLTIRLCASGEDRPIHEEKFRRIRQYLAENRSGNKMTTPRNDRGFPGAVS